MGGDRVGKAGLHQGVESLQAVAEVELVRVAAGDNLALHRQQGRGRAVRGIGGKAALGAPELEDGEAIPGGQRVVLPADADNGAAGQLPEGRPLGGGLLKGEHHLNVPVLQQVFQGVKGDQPQHGQQEGELLPQLVEDRGEEVQLQKAAAADAKAHLRGLLDLPQPGLGHPGEGEDLPGVLGEQVPRLGQPHPLAGSVEELDPQLVLQGVDLVAYRGLGNP